MLLLREALKYYGEQEYDGEDHNPIIVSFLQTDSFAFNSDEIPWCSAFINYIAKQVGLERTKNLTARLWLNVGEVITEPELGDLCILWRQSPKSWKGHVGIYIRQTEDKVWLLGGNQNNMVNIRSYNKTRLLGYRRLAPTLKG